MNKVHIEFGPNEVLPHPIDHQSKVSASLEAIKFLVPDHNSKSFKNSLWDCFKFRIWKAQGMKCCYCEKYIAEQESGLEHFRPKTKVTSIDNATITRRAYWWLAYDWKNFLISCSTCNRKKGTRFPLVDENTRVKDFSKQIQENGQLENEMPQIINPRYENPSSFLTYQFPNIDSIKIVYIKDIPNITEKGKITILVCDLNRKSTNNKNVRDMLLYKRGDVLNRFKSELDKLKTNYDKFKTILDLSGINLDLSSHIRLSKKLYEKHREDIRSEFLSETSEYLAMCKWWLKVSEFEYLFRCNN